MTDLTQGEVRALIAEIAELKKQLEDRQGKVSRFTNSANIKVDAGGFALWIVTILAGAMFALYWDTRDESRNTIAEVSSQLRELREKDEIHDAWIQTLNNKQKATK